MQHEIKSSKAELQFLQVEKRSLEVAQESIEKLQQECQWLSTEKDGLKTICENLHTKKDQLLSKIGELDLQKATLEESKRLSQVQETKLKEQVASLAASLEEAREQQTSIHPFKEHVLA